MRIKLSVFALLAVSSASASFVDYIGVRGGYSHAFQKLEEVKGVDVKEIKSDGWIYDLSAGFNVADEGFFHQFKPYVDVTGRSYSDRDANTIGVGLYHDFEAMGMIEPFVSAGVGYGMMRWQKAPLSNTESRDKTMDSVVGTLQGGMYVPLNDWLKLSLGVRLDGYNFTTKYKTETKTITQNDWLALSGMVGLNFTFATEAAPMAYEDSGEVKESASVEPVAVVATDVAVPPCDLSTLPRRIYFDFDDSQMNTASKEALDSVVACLGDHEATKVEFEGHTDSTGPTAYNQKLSLKRAESAKDYVVAKGLVTGRVVTTAQGESRPIADNTTAEGRAKNRRVDIYFVDGMEPIYFDYDSASIQKDIAKLEALLKALQAQPESQITVVGHTDSIGSDKFNKKLADKRAKAIAAFLIGNGIDAKRIVTLSKGESEPVADNSSDEGRAKNRRAEMELKH